MLVPWFLQLYTGLRTNFRYQTIDWRENMQYPTFGTAVFLIIRIFRLQFPILVHI